VTTVNIFSLDIFMQQQHVSALTLSVHDEVYKICTRPMSGRTWKWHYGTYIIVHYII